jgi:hypothetical protein
MLLRVAIVRTDVSDERKASIFSATGIGVLGKKFAVTGNRRTQLRNNISSSETSGLTRTTLRKIPEDFNLHSHSRGNLKSYIALTGWGLY